MAEGDPFHDLVSDMFAPLGHIRVRKMFGGAGVFADELMFALIADNIVYLKADGDFEKELLASGGESFTWKSPKTGKLMHMSYVSMPDAAMDDLEQARELGRRSLAIARQARVEKVKSPRRTIKR